MGGQAPENRHPIALYLRSRFNSPSPFSPQVYRARLREGGREVAVKVQRPGVKESIALDIYILRSLAVVIRRVRRINSDLGEILDEVGGSSHMR